MILYHVTSKKNAHSILKHGFKDRTGHFLTGKTFKGVWLSNRPLDCNEGVNECTSVLEITLSINGRELADYEWVEEGKSYREWLIPAVFINARSSVKFVQA